MSPAPTCLPAVSTLLEIPARLARWRGWGNTQAIGSIVLLEMRRRKDFYVLFILTALITLVLGAMNFFNEARIVRYLKEICLLLIWISSLVIAITTTARQIPAEREQRTVFPLLAKPVTRTELLLGKFWGCWQVAGLTLLTFYGFFALVSGAREHQWPLAAYGQALVLHWAMLGIVIAMTLLGSVVFAAPSSTNTIAFLVSAGILMLGRHLNHVALQLNEPLQTLVYAAYYLLPHLEWFDIRNRVIHDWGLVPWWAWSSALLYAAVYTAVFLVGAAAWFRRKTVL
ncbi:MAG: ABC transporter permease subunit [Verrucomicrobia bacterium]|nr:ABC transporter permease subunit [Verrucomicrobiota bacterium]